MPLGRIQHVNKPPTPFCDNTNFSATTLVSVYRSAKRSVYGRVSSPPEIFLPPITTLLLEVYTNRLTPAFCAACTRFLVPSTFTAKLRLRYSSVTDLPPISSISAAVWKIVSTPATAPTESALQMSPTTISSRGCAAIGDGTRSNERTQYPRWSSSAPRLQPTKPEPPVTMTLPRSVVGVASAMRASITGTRSNYEH